MTTVNPHMPACMGGWCAKRDHCPQHNAPPGLRVRNQPSERLCTPGSDGDAVGLTTEAKAHTLPSQEVAA